MRCAEKTNGKFANIGKCRQESNHIIPRKLYKGFGMGKVLIAMKTKMNLMSWQVKMKVASLKMRLHLKEAMLLMILQKAIMMKPLMMEMVGIK